MDEKIKTPYFVVKSDVIDCLVNELKQSLKKFYPKGIIGYSFKTNNLPWVITYMKKKGLHAEVVSSSEYQLAKELGYENKDIIFNGPVKNKSDFLNVLEAGGIVNIDSKRELNWLLECNTSQLLTSQIGLRVNFCLEDYCQGESQCGKEDGRFGFSYERGELKKAIEFLQNHNIPLSGLHLHCSSRTRSINIYTAIAQITEQIVNSYKLHLNYIDIGGGYFGGVEGKPSFDQYFSNVYSIFHSNPYLKGVNLVIEPGMSIIGAAMDYVTTVIDTKVTKNNQFAILDGSRIHVDPLMRKQSYTFRIRRNEKRINKMTQGRQIICGFTCMEADRFFSITDHLYENDQVVFEKVGAYTIGLSPQFIEFHPDIYELRNNEIKLIQSRRTAKGFIKED